MMARARLVATVLLGAACSSGGDATPAGPRPTAPVGGPGTPTLPPVVYVAGQTYLSADGAVEYVAGSSAFIVSAPHGGDLAPATIPDRTAARCPADDDFSAANDLQTQPLARLVADSLAARTGGRRPHLILARLARRKLDANRDSAAAACGDVAAGAAWSAYHAFLDSARAAVARAGAPGLVLDVHGHAHAVPRVELGYLLTATELGATDAMLDLSATLVQRSSIRTLAGGRVPFSALLRGGRSLGAGLERAGYAVVPGPRTPAPAVGEPYFNGGYITARHGCRGGGTVCAIQAELPGPGIRDTEESRQRFAGAMAEALVRFQAELATP